MRNMREIRSKYMQKWLSEKSDIADHMPVLKRYAKECEHITEMGVREVKSTWAFLYACPEKMVCIDWDKTPFEVPRDKLNEAAILAGEAGIGFQFISADTTEIEIEQTDLLFIDTWHTYEQLLLELLTHSDKVNKYILAHDTSEKVFPGMSHAVDDFLKLNPQWELRLRLEQFPGLTALARVEDGKANWGDFQKEPLLEEIKKQRSLFFEDITVEGPGSKAWWDYHNSLYERFKV